MTLLARLFAAPSPLRTRRGIDLDFPLLAGCLALLGLGLVFRLHAGLHGFSLCYLGLRLVAFALRRLDGFLLCHRRPLTPRRSGRSSPGRGRR